MNIQQQDLASRLHDRVNAFILSPTTGRYGDLVEAMDQYQRSIYLNGDIATPPAYHGIPKWQGIK